MANRDPEKRERDRKRISRRRDMYFIRVRFRVPHLALPAQALRVSDEKQAQLEDRDEERKRTTRKSVER
jgi:hypothetical protein